MELTDLEKRVILALAEKGPMSGYDFHLGGRRQRGNRRALMSSGYWLKIKRSLGPENKNFIEHIRLKRTNSTDERGRRKDLYWLTGLGFWQAITLGASIETLFSNAQQVDKEGTEFNDYLRDIISEIGEQEFRKYAKYCVVFWQNKETNACMPFAYHRILKHIPVMLRVMRKHRTANFVVEAREMVKNLRKMLDEL